MSRTVKRTGPVTAAPSKLKCCWALCENDATERGWCNRHNLEAAELGLSAPPAAAADARVTGVNSGVLVPADCVQPSEATALINSRAGNNPLTPYNPLPDGERRLATSIQLTSQAGQLAAYRAMSNQDHRAEDVIGQRFPVVNWLQHDCRKVDQVTGEIQRWVRTVLICEDGTRISCGSDGVIGSIMSLEGFFGKPPWSPAKILSIETGKSRAGYTYYTLDVH